MKRNTIIVLVLAAFSVVAVDLPARQPSDSARPDSARPDSAPPAAAHQAPNRQGVVGDETAYKITLMLLERPAADPKEADIDQAPPSPAERLMASRKREAKVLSEPTIITLEGRPASFHSGGQVPYIAGYENGRTRMAMFDFGTKIKLLPTAVEGGRVRLNLDLEVAERLGMKQSAMRADDGTAWTLDRPQVDRRSVSTTVDLKPGELFYIGCGQGKGDLGTGTERELYVTVEPLKH